MRRLLVLFLFLFIAQLGYSQCAQILRQGRTVYDEGRIHELPSLLASCIKSGFSDEERTEAYRLLILSYIYLDEPEKADETMLALLRDNPEFQINQESDPAELINLYGTFRTKPILKVGVKMGTNLTTTNLIQNGSVNNLNGEIDQDFSAGIGLIGGLVVELPFKNNKLSLALELSFNRYSFKSESNLYSNADGSIVTNTLFVENQNIAELSPSIQFAPFKMNISPFFGLGGSLNYLLNTTTTSSREVLGFQEIRENDIDLTDARQKLTYSIILSAGIKPKLNRGNVLITLRYKYGLVNVVNSDKTLDVAPEFIFDYYGYYSDFKTSHLELAIGYIFNIYNPKKISQ
ncbi:MAG: outer membrane beta-barrel protein [Fulvivirga sp.]